MILSFEDARDRLDELLDRVETQGPQRMVRGDTRFIVKLEHEEGQEENQLVRVFLDGPDFSGVEIECIKGRMRDVEFD